MTFDYNSLIVDPDPFPDLYVHIYKPDEFEVRYGWLLPCCTLIGTSVYTHIMTLMRIGKEERQAELEGWIKITQGPEIKGTGTFINKFYTVAYVCTKMTKKQKPWLTKTGFLFGKEDNGVQTYFKEPEGIKHDKN